MAVFKAKKVKLALLKKGFIEDDSHHHFYEYIIDGRLHARTRTSHNNQDIDDYLIGQMSRQCQLSKKQFIDLINCPLSKEEYAEILRNKI
jgi:hypothetical protein